MVNILEATPGPRLSLGTKPTYLLIRKDGGSAKWRVGQRAEYIRSVLFLLETVINQDRISNSVKGRKVNGNRERGGRARTSIGSEIFTTEFTVHRCAWPNETRKSNRIRGGKS